GVTCGPLLLGRRFGDSLPRACWPGLARPMHRGAGAEEVEEAGAEAAQVAAVAKPEGPPAPGAVAACRRPTIPGTRRPWAVTKTQARVAVAAGAPPAASRQVTSCLSGTSTPTLRACQ